jgi:hypothetical protein
MKMKKTPLLVLLLSSACVVGFVAAVRAGVVPLGVRGEWEWLRVPFRPGGYDLALAGVGVACYVTFAYGAFRALERKAALTREVVAVASLAVMAVIIQVVVQTGAPVGYGLEKWVTLSQKGSSGYFTLAKTEVRGIARFLARYPTWIQDQDALHIGTHPPGLIVAEYGLLRYLEGSPDLARFIDNHLPRMVALTFRLAAGDRPLSLNDRATIAATGMLTLLACSLTVVPLYCLARSSLPPTTAWSAAAIWPLMPSAILFQPTADTAFPLLSTSALALTAIATRQTCDRGRWPAFASGLILAIGMQFSLVFLAIGLIVAVVVVTSRERTVVEKGVLLAAIGVGFLAFTIPVWLATRANPFAIWWANQRNHARFYVENPRSYLHWVIANPIELAVAIGLPSALWLIVGAFKPRDFPRTTLATLAVLAFLTLSGRNLSEVARLWLPMMPPLFVGSAYGITSLRGGSKTFAATLGLVGAQTLALQATIQVVSPV